MLLFFLSNKKQLAPRLVALGAVSFFALVLVSCAPYSAQKRPQYRSKGEASWYGPGFSGRRTASGERFNPKSLTAAHRTLPFGTRLKVTNKENGKSVVVKVNDRGPFIGGRVLDLSKAAALRIGLTSTGTGQVEMLALSGPQ